MVRSWREKPAGAGRDGRSARPPFFEKATVEVDGSGVKIAYPESPFELVKPEGENGYWTEIDYFARCVQENLEPEICSPESTRDSIRIALAEEQSALNGGRRIEL